MKKYNIVYSIDLTKGVRFLELWANSIIEALSITKDKVAAENDTSVKNIHIIKVSNI